MSRWVRLWVDMPTDPKWRVIAKRAGRPISETLAVFMFMLANAGERNETQPNATERGILVNWSDEDVAAALDIETAHVAAIREAMQGKTLDGEKLTGWEKRQPKREDGSSERAKAWRERKRTQANAEKRPDSDSLESESNLLTTEPEPPRENEGKIRCGFGMRGGEVSPETLLAVAKKLNIGDPTPLVEIYYSLKISKQAKSPDALFRSQAPKLYANASDVCRQACQPLDAPPPPEQMKPAKAGAALVAHVTNGQRNAH